MPAPSDTFNCPHCQHQFKWKPQMAGKRARCQCGKTFHVPDRTVAAEDDNLLDELLPDELLEENIENNPEVDLDSQIVKLTHCPSCKQEISSGAVICINCGADMRSMRKLKTINYGSTQEYNTKSKDKPSAGLGMKIAGGALALHGLGAVLIMLGFCVNKAVTSFNFHAAWAGNVSWLCGVALLVGLALFGLSPFLCLLAPSKGGRNFVLSAIGCFILGIALVWFLPEGLTLLLANLLSLIGIGLFLGFLMKVGAFLDNDPLHSRAEFTIKTLIVIVACWVVVLFSTAGLGIVPISSIAGSLASSFVAIFATIGFIAELVFAFVYISTIFQAYHTIYQS